MGCIGSLTTLFYWGSETYGVNRPLYEGEKDVPRKQRIHFYLSQVEVRKNLRRNGTLVYMLWITGTYKN